MKRIIIYSLLVVFHTFTFAQVETTLSGGPWTSPSTWKDGVVPSPGDNVLIKGPVTIPLIVNINGVEVATTGSLKPEIINSNAYKIYISEYLINNGDINGSNLHIYFGGKPGGIFNEANGYVSINTFNVTDSLSHPFKSEGKLFSPKYFYAYDATLTTAGNVTIDSSVFKVHKFIQGENLQFEKVIIQKHSKFYVDEYVNNPSDTAGIEFNNNSFIGGDANSGIKASFSDVILRGDIGIGQPLTFKGNIFNYGKIFPQFSSNYTLTFENNFYNYGQVTSNTNGYKFYFEIYGDLLNSGTWSSYKISMLGNSDHTVSTDPDYNFSPTEFEALNSKIIVPTTLNRNSRAIKRANHFQFLRFDNGAKVRVKYLTLEGGTQLYLTTGSNLAVDSLDGNGNDITFIDNSYIGYYSSFGNTTLSNVTLKGDIGVSGNQYWYGDININGRMYPEFSSSPVINIRGNIYKTGTITNNANGYKLYFNISGDLSNSGDWMSNDVIFTGNTNHSLTMDTNYTFSCYQFSCDSGSVQAGSSLKFLGTKVSFAKLILSDGYSLVFDNSEFRGYLDAAGQKITFLNNSYLGYQSGWGFTTIENSLLNGNLGIGYNVIFKGETISNASIFPQFSSSPRIYLLGNFTNDGKVVSNNNGYKLYFNSTENLTNNGDWESNEFRFVGTNDHQITVDTTKTFSTNSIHADSSLILPGSDLKFDNTKVYFKSVKLSQGHRLIFNSSVFNGRIEGNNTPLFFNNNSYITDYSPFPKTELINCDLYGECGIGGNIIFTDSVTNHANIYPQFSSAPTIHVNGDFKSFGNIWPNRNGYKLYFKITGDLTSYGEWNSYDVQLLGNSQHIFAQDTANTFSANHFKADSSTIVVYSPIKLYNTKFHFKTLKLNSASSLTLNASEFEGEIFGENENRIIFHNSYIVDRSSISSALTNVTLEGDVGIGSELVINGKVTLNGNMFPQFFSSPRIQVEGSFYNNGAVKPNSNNYKFYFSVNGDIYNSGSWDTYNVEVTGTNDQYIGLGINSQFNDITFYSDVTGSNYQWYWNGVPLPQANNKTLQFNPLIFSNRGNYYCDIDGGTYRSRTIIVDTVAASLSAPVLLNPMDGQVGVELNPTLEWTGVPSATEYKVYFKTPSTGNENIFVTDSTHIMIQNLGYNTLFEWKVRAFNSQGDSSSLSTVYSFTTMLNTPVPIQPLAGTDLSDSTVNFIWTSVEGGDFFNLWVSKDSSFNQPLVIDTLVYDTTFSSKFVPDKYFWKVIALGNNGNYSYYSSPQSFRILVTNVENHSNIPKEFSLGQNYPNPFNPETTIKFAIPSTQIGSLGQHVKIVLYDALGRKVRTLVNDNFKPGRYSITFHPQQLSSGIYYYKMTCKNYSNVKKMILLK